MGRVQDCKTMLVYKTVRRFRQDKRANVMLEFALTLPFLVMMVVGTFAVGLMFDRHLTEGQLARNAANMFARGIKFDSTQNKQLLSNAATGMNLQVDGTGDTVVYMTLLTRVPMTANCVGGGGGTVPCANRGLVVMAQRYIVGNTAIRACDYGEPGAANIDSEGNIFNYEHESYALATAPAAITNPASGIKDGEFVYAVDVHHNPALIKFPGIVAPDQMGAWAFY
jgi:Flp pilus assembly protein TadG